MVRKKTILHADDVARWRDYVRGHLSAAYNVETVNDCDAVMPRLDEGGIDLVILDHLMPGTDPTDTGFEVGQRIRERYPGIPMIVLTGAWREVDVNREELEELWQVSVVFKEIRDSQKDDLVARVGEALTST